MFRWFGKSEHERLRELLSPYIDGRFSAQEKIRVEKHLGECEECRRALESLGFTVGLLHRIPTVQVPRSFALTEAPGRRALVAAWPVKAIGTASALAAVLLAAVFTIDLLDLFVQEAAPAIEEGETLALEAQELPEAAPQEEALRAQATPEESPAPQPAEEETPIGAAPEEEVRAPPQVEEKEFPFWTLELALLGTVVGLSGFTAYVVWMRRGR